MPVLTWSPVENGNALWSIWWVSKEAATPGSLEVVTDAPPVTDLSDAWPVEYLATASVVIVGVGSIGSVIAETLASYAVGELALVDPDRLLRHNLVRHRLGRRDLGRFKVNAMADLLQDRYPHIQAERYPVDVIYEADLMRPLFAHADVIVGATDGVASRRVINHLARRAQVPAVLACVLEDGALGEVVRVRPGTGCLLCYRAKLEADGSLDPEPRLDQDYSLGSPHLPMTAVTGDLATVGTLAGKIAVSTLLERQGRWAQRLPGDVAVIGLQPVPDLPPPFNLERAGDVRWDDIGPSVPDCPTCAAA
jgi:molybdopterin/thiamine biosynthesis adenylyltransferase